MKAKLKYIIVAIILTERAFFGAFSVGDVGTRAGSFLKMGAGARAAGLAETYIAVCDDASAVYWNPAALNHAGNFGVTLMHALWFENISYEWGSLNFDTGIGKIGLGVQYVAYGLIMETDANGLESGNFVPNDLSASLSYAERLCGFDLGFTTKYVSMTIKQSATAFVFDAGLGKILDLPGIRVNLVVTANNLGQSISFGVVEEQLTAFYKLGCSLSFEKNILIAVEACIPSDNALFYSTGVEYSLLASNNLEIKLRGGYNTRNIMTGGLSGFTFGLGLGNREYSVDYAFVPYGTLGYTHRASFSVAFGKSSLPVSVNIHKLPEKEKIEETSGDKLNRLIQQVKKRIAAMSNPVITREETLKKGTKAVSEEKETLEEKNKRLVEKVRDQLMKSKEFKKEVLDKNGVEKLKMQPKQVFAVVPKPELTSEKRLIKEATPEPKIVESPEERNIRLIKKVRGSQLTISPDNSMEKLKQQPAAVPKLELTKEQTIKEEEIYVGTTGRRK